MAILDNVDFRFIAYDSLAFDDDTITGRDLSGFIDFIDGGGGVDDIDGRDGSDVLIGGAGEDEVFGGDGGNMDFLIGGILDFVEGVDVEETLDGISEFLEDAESSGFLEAVVDVLDDADNLQDVVVGVTEALSNEPIEFQQVVAGILEVFPQVLTWLQDESVDVFKAADSFEENGVDIIFGYDDDHDIIDFGTIINLPSGEDVAKENAVNDFIAYDETTGALTDDDDNNWFFVYSDFNPFNPAPAETVRIEVDGDVFVWDTGSDEFDILV